MKKLLLFVLASITIVCVAFSQCTPDPSLTSPGFHPDSTQNLPPGTVNVFYEAVISAFIPSDTVVDLGMGPITVQIDSIGLLNVTGLPTGLSWVSDSPNNYWDGGVKGCILISGTTALEGVHDLMLLLRIHADLGGMPIVQDDTVKFYKIDMQPQSVNELQGDVFTVGQAYPNPANDMTTIEIVTSKPATVMFSLTNIMGMQMTESVHQIVPGTNKITISLKQYPAGLYFYKIRNGEMTVTRKVNIVK